ncbi:hypothetical protein VTK56DRAFT_5825 [Thermocarpiscus australiensis]
MPSSRRAATPTTPYPMSGAVLSSTPSPRPADFTGDSYASPSPPISDTWFGSRELGNPGSTSHYLSAVIDINSPAGPASSPKIQGQPSLPAAHVAAYTTGSLNPPRTSSLAPKPANPLRTSSLLPPARIAVDSAAASRPIPPDPFNDPRPAPEPPHRKRDHSRSSSAGGLSDSLRNLNRWSASTASSRASNLAAFTRRVSTEILGAAFGSPGRKSQNSRPSTSSGSPRSVPQPGIRSRSPELVSIPPLQSLPRISTGPSLEDQVLESNVLGRFSPTEKPQYSRPSNEDTGGFWGGGGQVLEEGPRLSPQPPATAETPPAAETVISAPTMPYTQNGPARSHSRSGSAGTRGNAEGTISSRSRDRERDRDRDRDRSGKPPSQKAMLSKALQKANTAVQLDNAQNFEGARRAYAEACAVLQQVLLRTPGEEDRKKLEAIHNTYLGRVMELDEQLVDVEPDEKELPQRPESNGDDLHDELDAEVSDDEYRGVFTSARERHYGGDHDMRPDSYARGPSAERPSASRAAVGASVDASRDSKEKSTSYLSEQYSLQSAFSRARYRNGSTLQPPMDSAYMPPPLSPRRPPSPAKPPASFVEEEIPERAVYTETRITSSQRAQDAASPGHQRVHSHESVSWLDPIDESGGSSASSVHSRSSSRIRRKHIRAASGATEAEFDAALDDAIEAAYNDGYEPDSQYTENLYQADPKTLQRLQQARERVSEAEREREALELANERERNLRLQQQLEDEEYRKQEAMGEDFYDGLDSDEEERLLEEMTSGNAIEDFAFEGHSRPPVPRESNSSGALSHTWHSSIGSNPHTASTVLTPVSEHNALPHPMGPLPALPTQTTSQLPPQPHSAGSQSSGQSVRNRRLSGQNPKQLKIETTKLVPTAPPFSAGLAVPSQPRSGNYIVQQRQALSAGPNRTVGPLPSRPAPSPVPRAPGDDFEEDAVPPMNVIQDEHPRIGTPSVVRPALRKNFSSSSLQSLRTRNPSISHLDESSDLSPGTPVGNQFGIGGSFARLPAVPSLPPQLKDRANSTGTSGLHLFENHFHSPDSPGSPNVSTPDAPAPLEPCPTDVMLRPFWLMRCLYQTLCHPRGGYLSNKLFVPRDVWSVKGVKLKNLEDKIANCDLLTAALQRLARVDTCDADAVLEEMQALEGVLEQVQATLSRKLGSDVGIQGTSSLFKEANAVDAEAAAMPRSASVAGKAGGFSWRRLRSKNSSANLPATAYGGKGGSGGGTGSAAAAATTAGDGSGGKDSLLPSLPMTSHPTSRPTKRDVGNVFFSGPNANYMASLAKLFDAAQAVDQIARQVDDPGLRHADKTQVGLELCTRHAAEFFAFYVCRFALSDLALLLDKFVKRGSEWVLA